VAVSAASPVEETGEAEETGEPEVTLGTGEPEEAEVTLETGETGVTGETGGRGAGAATWSSSWHTGVLRLVVEDAARPSSEGHFARAHQATGLAPEGTTVAGQRRDLTGLR
jgi:hypothetical protein